MWGFSFYITKVIFYVLNGDYILSGAMATVIGAAALFDVREVDGDIGRLAFGSAKVQMVLLVTVAAVGVVVVVVAAALLPY